MTREEKQKAIEALKISAPVMAVTQEEFNNYIQTINQVMDWLEQEPCEDVVSRAEVRKIAKEMYLEVANMELDVNTISDCISCTSSKCREVLERKLQGLPPVTPQEPNTWSLDDAREGKNESRCEEIVRIIDGKA